MATIGSPTPAHVTRAAELLASIPEELAAAARGGTGAQALIFALLSAVDQGTSSAQEQLVREHGGEELVGRVRALHALVREQPAETRLPLLDLALPALKELPAAEARAFRQTVHRLVHADGRLHMFEWALVRVLARQLELREAPVRRTAVIHSLKPIRPEVELALSAVALTGTADDAAAREAFTAGARHLPADGRGWRLLPAGEIDIGKLDRALTAIEDGSPGVRRRFLEACARIIAYDGKVLPAEAELFRAISESLEAPVPPLLAG
jgi:hypothetical protein